MPYPVPNATCPDCPQFKTTIESMLPPEFESVEDIPVGTLVRVENGEYVPLDIDRVSEEFLVVGKTLCNGEREPRIRFRLTGGGLVPVEIKYKHISTVNESSGVFGAYDFAENAWQQKLESNGYAEDGVARIH